MACYKSALIDLDRRWANKGQVMNNWHRKDTREHILIWSDEWLENANKSQPNRLRRVDTCKELPDSLNWCDPTTSEAIVGSANIDEIAESSRND